MVYRAIFFLLGSVNIFAGKSAVFGQEAPKELVLPIATNKPATLTFEQLRAGITRRDQELRALDVTYRQWTRVMNSGRAS